MILGIDLGTTNSLAAVWRQGKVELIPNQFGEVMTPSVVGLSDDGELIVGKLAKERLMSHPHLTQSQFKRHMGTPTRLSLGDKTYSAEELSSFVLRKLVEDAEVYLGEKIEEVLVSVPAYFNDEQRSATKRAGQLAGIKIERLINEPSAAALALHQNRQEDKCYLVIDFGGGTLDISVVDAFQNVIEIVSVAGDNHLGGEDFTQVIVADFFKAWPSLKNKLTPAQQAQLYQKADRLKQELDQVDEAKFTLTVGQEVYRYQLTQQRFLSLSHPLLQGLEAPIRRALRDAKLSLGEIDDVVLVGGNTKLPVVRHYLAYLLKRSLRQAIDQDQAIVLGCGMMAGIKARQEDIKDLVLTDICPFTLGTEIVGDVYSPIIERNTVLPSSRVQTYYTNRYGQEELEVCVYQGEQMTASKNLLLGKMRVRVPKNMTAHEAVDVRFSYDINGILEVDVLVKSTGQVISQVFRRDQEQLTDKEVAQKRQELAALKIHPREKEAYQLLTARAQRLYEFSLGEERHLLVGWLEAYEAVVEKQDLRDIAQAENLFKAQLDALEKRQNQGGYDDF